MIKNILTIGPNGGAHKYSSASAASRALSGDGSTRLRQTISRRANSKVGGFVGRVWVGNTNITKINKRK